MDSEIWTALRKDILTKEECQWFTGTELDFVIHCLRKNAQELFSYLKETTTENPWPLPPQEVRVYFCLINNCMNKLCELTNPSMRENIASKHTDNDDKINLS